MTFDPKQDLLFVGSGATAVAHYRCFLPAMALGADHVGVLREPPRLLYATGLVQGESRIPDFSDYKVVIVQQPRGTGWLTAIKALQAKHVKVIFEVDDWLHAVHSVKDHDFRQSFGKRELAEYEACMKACDAMIVSTNFLAQTYRRFNRNIFVCENGIDSARYDLQRPAHDSVNIGWAGGTGHRAAVIPWMQAVVAVMRVRDNVCFMSIGENFADGLRERYPQHRYLSVPFAAMEQYPAAMTAFDIAIGPAAHSGFYRGKSDLRWLEASALGIPFVGHPLVYTSVVHERTGLLAATPADVEAALLRLVDDSGLRIVLGANAQTYVLKHRTAEAVAPQWVEAAEAVIS